MAYFACFSLVLAVELFTLARRARLRIPDAFALLADDQASDVVGVNWDVVEPA